MTRTSISTHTTEDTGIAIGTCVSEALGDRAGITRYGSALIPMDETLTRVALDMSNRPYLIWKVDFDRPKLGDFDTELFKEWFQAFAQAAGITLHVERSVWREQPSHRRIQLQGTGEVAPAGAGDRSAQIRCCSLDQGCAGREPLKP